MFSPRFNRDLSRLLSREIASSKLLSNVGSPFLHGIPISYQPLSNFTVFSTWSNNAFSSGLQALSFPSLMPIESRSQKIGIHKKDHIDLVHVLHSG